MSLVVDDIRKSTGRPATFSDLSDASTTAPSVGDVPVFDGTSWVPGPAVASGGSAQVYGITGHTTGLTTVADYADIAAFEAAISATPPGSTARLAGYPSADKDGLLVAIDGEWGLA